MARRLRIDRGGLVYHVLNRRVARLPLFEKDGDYASFENVLDEAFTKVPMRVLCYCLMPNHWHLVVWPSRDGQLSRYMQWVTTTHMRRWHAHRGTRGMGPVYQGRFKSFPIQEDRHCQVVCRYVERNALRANLVKRAQDWPWSSMRRRREDRPDWLVALKDWPIPLPRDWASFVNRPETAAELEAMRRSVFRGAPFGERDWQQRTAARLQLTSSLRPPHRPRKIENPKK